VRRIVITDNGHVTAKYESDDPHFTVKTVEYVDIYHALEAMEKVCKEADKINGGAE
jgi:hypothetical protein